MHDYSSFPYIYIYIYKWIIFWDLQIVEATYNAQNKKVCNVGMSIILMGNGSEDESSESKMRSGVEVK